MLDIQEGPPVRTADNSTFEKRLSYGSRLLGIELQDDAVVMIRHRKVPRVTPDDICPKRSEYIDKYVNRKYKSPPSEA